MIMKTVSDMEGNEWGSETEGLSSRVVKRLSRQILLRKMACSQSPNNLWNRVTEISGVSPDQAGRNIQLWPRTSIRPPGISSVTCMKAYAE